MKLVYKDTEDLVKRGDLVIIRVGSDRQVFRITHIGLPALGQVFLKRLGEDFKNQMTSPFGIEEIGAEWIDIFEFITLREWVESRAALNH